MKFSESVLLPILPSSRPSAQLWSTTCSLPGAPAGPWTRGEVLHLWLEPPSIYHTYGQVWHPCYILIDADLWNSVPKFRQQTHKESSTRALPTIQYGKSDSAGWFKRKWQRSNQLCLLTVHYTSSSVLCTRDRDMNTTELLPRGVNLTWVK